MYRPLREHKKMTEPQENPTPIRLPVKSFKWRISLKSR
jgi:hypothetical protein